ncbi:unnamed protein product [Vicia faba]|uniref:Uncharacterized protein n=1 Tax=Vicia faba TaxID=3906 RepID=A0AAV1AC27_VICFA|nr:unnamed protein product [Vicia faba]
MSDHLVLWYNPASCRQIMEADEEIKVSKDVNNTSYNPKLTFRFFIDETLYDEVAIKQCGFRWIYQEETISSAVLESQNEVEEEIVSSSDFQSGNQKKQLLQQNLNWMIKEKQFLQQRFRAMCFWNAAVYLRYIIFVEFMTAKLTVCHNEMFKIGCIGLKNVN